MLPSQMRNQVLTTKSLSDKIISVHPESLNRDRNELKFSRNDDLCLDINCHRLIIRAMITSHDYVRKEKQPVSKKVERHKDYCVVSPSLLQHKENLDDIKKERKVNEVDPRNNTHQIIGSDLPFIFHHTQRNDCQKKENFLIAIKVPHT